MAASIHRGTERRTGGTTMAAAMPANKASENWSIVVFPIERETRSLSRVLGLRRSIDGGATRVIGEAGALY
jgi:hypothetical protein